MNISRNMYTKGKYVSFYVLLCRIMKLLLRTFVHLFSSLVLSFPSSTDKIRGTIRFTCLVFDCRCNVHILTEWLVEFYVGTLMTRPNKNSRFNQFW